jgi:hypothetical protein
LLQGISAVLEKIKQKHLIGAAGCLDIGSSLGEIKTILVFGKMNPYTDLIESDSSVIRVFDENIDPIELKWHRDLEDRRITVLDGSGWYYQKEDELPIELLPGVDIFIRALEWHRVIKGETSLKIKIQ